MEPRIPVQQTRGTEAFLQTEEEVNRLLTELTRLQQEAASYASAKQTVDKAAAGVSTLSSDLVNLAGRLREIVDTLRSISTPEILDQLEGVKNDVSESRQHLETQVETAKQHTRELIARHVGEVRDDVSSTRRELSESRTQFEEALRASAVDTQSFVAARVSAAVTTLTVEHETRFTAVDSSLSTLHANASSAERETAVFRTKITRIVIGLGTAQLIALAVVLWKVFA